MTVGRVIRLALVAGLLLGAVSAPSSLEWWEYGGAHLQLNRVRMLTERLSRQNLLFHFKLAGEQRRSIVDTAAQIDAAIAALIEGSPGQLVPKPPDLEMRRKVEALDSAWGALRATAVATPFEYARRAAERGSSDPLGIRHFEHLALGVYESADVVSAAYLERCEKQVLEGCREVAAATASGMLSERLMKELAFVITGVDVKSNSARLIQSRDRLDLALTAAGKQEAVQSTMSPSRGQHGAVTADIWSEIERSWKELRANVDQTLEGEGDQVVLGEALAHQHDLLRDLQRMSVAVRRFSAARRAAGGGPPS